MVRHGVEQGSALTRATHPSAAIKARAAASSRGVELFEWALIAVGFAALFALLPHALEGDDPVRFAEIQALLDHGRLSNGRYSLVMPLASSPLLLLGRVVASPTWWAERFNVVVTAAAVFVSWRLVRGRVDARLFRVSVLVLLYASYLTNRLRSYDAEVFTAALVTVGILALATGRHPVLAWIAIVIGVVNTPAAIGGLVLLTGARVVATRRLRAFWPVVAAAALIGLEDWVRRGGPLATGYGDNHGYHTVLPYSGRPGFSYPFLFGLISILFSFGRGLFVFMPGIALWFGSGERRLLGRSRGPVAAMLLFALGLVLVYSKWWAWYGGIAWGPRFFTFVAVPASILLASRLLRPPVRRLEAAVALGLLTVSAWVAVAGVIASLDSLAFCYANTYQYESLCWYSPEFSPLGRPLVTFPPVTWSSGIVVALCLLVYVYLAAPLAAALAPSRAHLPLRGWSL